MPMGLRQISGPAVEPVILDDSLRVRLRLDGTSEDDDVAEMIREARELCEAECGRAFITQTFSLYLDEFPAGGGEIRIPRPPLQSVEWVKYRDTNGDLQTLSDSTYFVATGSEPGRIWPKWGNYWPYTELGRPEAVEIRFTAGYGLTGEETPAAVRAAIKLLVAHRYTHRGDDDSIGLPPAVRRLLDSLETGAQWP